MRRLTLHASALNNDEYDGYTRSLKELAEVDGEAGGDDSDEYFERLGIGVREVRAWLRGRYPALGPQTIDSILKFFSASLRQGDTLTGGQFFAVLRLVTHVQQGKELDRDLAFVQGACCFSCSFLG
ncbi:hypothetical protein FA15DRAFT_673261 [Coprinopsis marcescibilis]|uniref:Uncharacterized protein n=1 Tax=Coprinopsis marcescibilis TaxID=230819 RepID=A0A5C3KK06_COPMA|nr:hypothetical protein FA15DRAFT_673261 [Coprinopsis marcescibilis]